MNTNNEIIESDRSLTLIIAGILILFAISCSSSRLVVDRSNPPALGPPTSFSTPAIEHFELSNGLPVIILKKHNVPVVQINLIVYTGSIIDPIGKEGLASITASMMDEGAGEYDALELADAVDFLGAHISVNAGLHTTVVSLNSTLSKLYDALDLYSDIVLRPTFPEEELERKRKERLNSLLQRHDEARQIAAILFKRTLFGAEHPYGRETFGTESSLNSFTREDLVSYYKTQFKPNNSSLIVVGDVEESTILPKLESIFSSWEAAEVNTVKVPEPAQVEGRKVYVVDKPGATQTVIRIGRIGVDRYSEDYYPIVVMNTILGGSFASRLNQNLREDNGYTYGARSFFNFRHVAGAFGSSADVQTEVTKESLTEFFIELNGIVEAVSDEELTRAKNYVALRFPGRFQTVRSIAEQLADIEVYDLPIDYYDSYVENVLSVSMEDVRRVAQKYIVPDNVLVILVGDSDKILDGVKELGLGEVLELTIEDVLDEPPVGEN